MAPLQAKRGTDCPRRGVRLGGDDLALVWRYDDGYLTHQVSSSIAASNA